MKLEQLMTDLAKELEAEEGLKTEVPGVYALPLDEGLTLFISSLPRGGISFKAALCPVPTKTVEEFYTEALRANLFGEGTDGAVLGLDGVGGHLTLSREIDYDMDFPKFHDAVEDFINSIDFWREETETYR